MRTVIVGDCAARNSFVGADPDAPSEIEFEATVVRTISCAYPAYDCFVFTGGFRLDGDVSRPDLALVAKDRSHWFVIEVELTSHSLEKHVLPQVRAFQYGTPEPDCVSCLIREIKIDEGRAVTLLNYVPRSVAVIANRRVDKWEVALNAHNIQMLTVSVFKSPSDAVAVEIEGTLEVVARSLGFGTYSATDRSLRFPKSVDLNPGKVQLHDPRGGASLWTASESGDTLWITKDFGSPDIEDGHYVQIVQTVDGRLSLRAPR